MDSILSTVLSIFSHNPIIVLGIIAYVAFSIIRGKNNEESDEYESYESSSSEMTWEDMEREYGISIEKKPAEPSPEDLLYDDDFYRDIFKNRPIENQHREAPLLTKEELEGRYDSIPEVDERTFKNRSNNDAVTPATATQQDTEVLPKKRTSSSSSYTTSTTRLSREATTGPSLNERLAEFKRDKASKEGRVLVESVGVTTAPTAPAVTSTRRHKSNHALKEGMKWSIILGKPKALERRYR